MQGYLEFDIFDIASVNKVYNKFLASGGISSQLEKAVDNALDEIMFKAVQRMRMIMSTMPTMNGTLGSSQLASTISDYRIEDGFVIEVEGDYALYVEFGTGVVGKDSPHPNAVKEGWGYDVNGHGNAGWYYIGEDGERHWTKGMPSRPYMYQTYLYVRRIMTKTIQKHLKKVLG